MILMSEIIHANKRPVLYIDDQGKEYDITPHHGTSLQQAQLKHIDAVIQDLVISIEAFNTQGLEQLDHIKGLMETAYKTSDQFTALKKLINSQE